MCVIMKIKEYRSFKILFSNNMYLILHMIILVHMDCTENYLVFFGSSLFFCISSVVIIIYTSLNYVCS